VCVEEWKEGRQPSPFIYFFFSSCTVEFIVTDGSFQKVKGQRVPQFLSHCRIASSKWQAAHCSITSTIHIIVNLSIISDSEGRETHGYRTPKGYVCYERKEQSSRSKDSPLSIIAECGVEQQSGAFR